MSDALTAAPDARFPFDRRGGDRRRRSTPMLSRYTLFGGRRAHDRRNPGSVNQYVDRYPAMLAAGLIAIGLLCALDAVFTLIHLQKGGSEANPIMDALITAAGPRAFLVLKCIITNVGLIGMPNMTEISTFHFGSRPLGLFSAIASAFIHQQPFNSHKF